MVQLDTNQVVFNSFLNPRSRQATLPPLLSKKIVDNLSEKTGVYYFLNEKKEVIYVGKANNIKQRVISHFYDKSKKEQTMCLETSNITFEETGNELVALLKESSEIKKIYEPSIKNTFNPQKTDGKPYKEKVKPSDINKELSNYRAKIKQSSNESGQRFPKSIIKFKPDIDKIHPTQKPIKLNEYLINTYSNKDDLVLDFCFGSGSSIIACINTKRNYIGCEKDADIFNLASERIYK